MEFSSGEIATVRQECYSSVWALCRLDDQERLHPIAHGNHLRNLRGRMLGQNSGWRWVIVRIRQEPKWKRSQGERFRSGSVAPGSIQTSGRRGRKRKSAEELRKEIETAETAPLEDELSSLYPTEPIAP